MIKYEYLLSPPNGHNFETSQDYQVNKYRKLPNLQTFPSEIIYEKLVIL